MFFLQQEKPRLRVRKKGKKSCHDACVRKKGLGPHPKPTTIMNHDAGNGNFDQ
jgi:hypothetical protein